MNGNKLFAHGAVLVMATVTLLAAMPAAEAAPYAYVLGSGRCDSRTDSCTWSLYGLHGAQIVGVPDAGTGIFEFQGLTVGTCSWVSGASCVSGAVAFTATSSTGCFTVYAKSTSVILGGYAQDGGPYCNHL